MPTQDQTRRERMHAPRVAKHRGVEGAQNFSSSFTALGRLAYSGAQVSACVTDLYSGAMLLSVDDRIVLPIAGVGRVLLLIEVAARMTERDATGFGILDKAPSDPAGSSGIWQRLQAPALPVADLATLVGAVGDNLATNVLLQRIGLDAVRDRTELLGLSRTALLDFAREHRGLDDAPQLAVGSAAELGWLFAALARGQVVNAPTSQRVLGWLSLGCDLSMVAGAFGLDPLSHRTADGGIQLINVTGTAAGVRCEVGLLYGPRAAVAYAVTVTFPDTGLASRLGVTDAMRRVGFDLLEHVH